MQIALPIRETSSCGFSRAGPKQICAGEASNNTRDVKDACRVTEKSLKKFINQRKIFNFNLLRAIVADH